MLSSFKDNNLSLVKVFKKAQNIQYLEQGVWGVKTGVPRVKPLQKLKKCASLNCKK